MGSDVAGCVRTPESESGLSSLARASRGVSVVDDFAALPPKAGPNPLRKDLALFEAYVNALDGALANPEIRIAVDELSIPIGRLRNRMVAEAGRVLRGAPREFAEYQRALALEMDAPDFDARMITHGSRRDLAFIMRVFLIVTTVPGRYFSGGRPEQRVGVVTRRGLYMGGRGHADGRSCNVDHPAGP